MKGARRRHGYPLAGLGCRGHGGHGHLAYALVVDLALRQLMLLEEEQVGEPSYACRHPATIPQLEGHLLKGQADNVAVGEGEGIVTSIMRQDPDSAIPQGEGAGAQGRNLFGLPPKDHKSSPHSGVSEPHCRDTEVVAEDALEPWQESSFGWSDVDKTDEGVLVRHNWVVHIEG